MYEALRDKYGKLFDDFMSARDKKTGEIFGEFAARTQMEPEIIDRWISDPLARLRPGRSQAPSKEGAAHRLVSARGQRIFAR